MSKKLIIILILVIGLLFIYKFDRRTLERNSEKNNTPTSILTTKPVSKLNNLLREITSNRAEVVHKYSFNDNKEDVFEKEFLGKLGNSNYRILYSVKEGEDGWKEGGINVQISRDGKILMGNNFPLTMLADIWEIKNYDKEYLLVVVYTGGAHCCTELYLYTLSPNGSVVRHLLDNGNIDVVQEDDFFIKNDNLYISTMNDDFAYFEMSYAGSGFMFFPVFYRIDEKGFKLDREGFKNFYWQLHNDYEIYQDGSQKECFPANDSRPPFTALVNRYTLGYMAGLSNEELENEFVKDWCIDSNKQLSVNEPKLMIKKVREILEGVN